MRIPDCQPYFVHQAIPPTATSMLMATAGDLALTIATYLAVAVLRGAQWGLQRWNAWSTLMPGTRVSLLPVLQLVLLLPLTFLLARSLTARFSPPPGSQARGPQP